MNNDKLIIGGHEFNSRFILGSGKYSMKLIEAAVKEHCNSNCSDKCNGNYKYSLRR